MIQVPQKLPCPILKNGKRIKIRHKYQKETKSKEQYTWSLLCQKQIFIMCILTWTYILQLISYISSNSLSGAGLISSPITKNYNIKSNVGEVI